MSYTYAFGQLMAAERYDMWSGTPAITMSYVYDASGGRVIRQKADIASSVDDIVQDLYIAGGYELRQVQLQDTSGNPVSIYADPQDGVVYEDIEGTRLVKYASGARIQWKVLEGDDELNLTEDPQIFLTFANHLGSTSAVTDFADGTLVEWNTNYAYGADESKWKNPDTKYDNSEEPYGFTGKEEDVEVGLHYFGARYYSSTLGRWISPDPPIVQGSVSAGNYYAYCYNSPYIHIDPDGNTGVFSGLRIPLNLLAGAIEGGKKDGFWGAIGGIFKGLVEGLAEEGVGGSMALALSGDKAGAGKNAGFSVTMKAVFGARMGGSNGVSLGGFSTDQGMLFDDVVMRAVVRVVDAAYFKESSAKGYGEEYTSEDVRRDAAWDAGLEILGVNDAMEEVGATVGSLGKLYNATKADKGRKLTDTQKEKLSAFFSDAGSGKYGIRHERVFSKYNMDNSINKVKIHKGMPWFKKSGSAITIDNHIYLSKRDWSDIVDENEQGMALLAHETVHVAQYQKYGVEGFMSRYLADYIKNGLKEIGQGTKGGVYNNLLLEREARPMNHHSYRADDWYGLYNKWCDCNSGIAPQYGGCP